MSHHRSTPRAASGDWETRGRDRALPHDAIATFQRMLQLLGRRLLLAIPTLFGVMVVVFLLLYVAPGDPVQAMVGERADSATIARLRAELRLDDPLPVQFAHYAAGVLRGDLGRSYITNRPIIDDIAERFPRTLLLATTAMLLA